jgi:predicted ATPase
MIHGKSMPGGEDKREPTESLDDVDAAMAPSPGSIFVRGVQLRNYKSIATCKVDLGSLTFLVGANGSGKSNFLDALRFVSDALNTTLEQALRDRGGIGGVRRRSGGHPTHFGIRLDMNLPDRRTGSYAFKVGAERDGGFVVQREECRIHGIMPQPDAFFVVQEGKVVDASTRIASSLERDRLALVAISGLKDFNIVYDRLRRMGFYNLNPERIRDLQDPDPGVILARDGRNLAAIIREFGRLAGGRVLEEVSEHLQAVVPGVSGVTHRVLGPKETLEFRQYVAGSENPWRFGAADMSDGTLRALGVLAAAFQGHAQRRVSLVGIEEPEVALHPGAAQVITSVLLQASRDVQVVATTHSPDLLDHKAISDEHLLTVSNEGGQTVIGPVNKITRSALRERLYTTGEMLRMGQLEPDADEAAARARQVELFSGRAE